MAIRDKLLLTIPEAMEVTGYGRTFLLSLLAKNSIPSLKVGKTRRIPRASLERWIDEQMAAGGRAG